jgi:hypothetical protein
MNGSATALPLTAMRAMMTAPTTTRTRTMTTTTGTAIARIIVTLSKRSDCYRQVREAIASLADFEAKDRSEQIGILDELLLTCRAFGGLVGCVSQAADVAQRLRDQLAPPAAPESALLDLLRRAAEHQASLTATERGEQHGLSEDEY